MEAQLGALLAQLTTQNQTLAENMQAQQQHNDLMFRSLANAVTSMQNRSTGVVDVRQVGKPDILKGNRDSAFKEWPTWSYMFVTWFSSQFESGEDILNWARDHPTTGIGQAEIDAAMLRQGGWAELPKINAQLQVALVSLCRDEALTIVRNSNKGFGLDAWRRLCREYEPTTDQANLRLLKRVLQPPQQSIDNLRMAIETWEREYREYHERTLEDLSDSVLRLTLQAMCPPALQEHLEFHSGRLSNYKTLKAEIDSYLDIKTSTKPMGPAPMDVDSLGKGKGKAKGKGKQPQHQSGHQQCKHCHRNITAVHTEWACWYNPKNKSPEAVAKRNAKGSPEGKSGKGKGKPGKGKPKGGKSGVHSLEGQDWPEEQQHPGNSADMAAGEASCLFVLEAVDEPPRRRKPRRSSRSSSRDHRRRRPEHREDRPHRPPPARSRQEPRRSQEDGSSRSPLQTRPGPRVHQHRQWEQQQHQQHQW